MTLTEQTEMDAFLEEALATGRIRQSKSPLGAPVFFIKKKDGKLRFVQDYRALNAITNSLEEHRWITHLVLDRCGGYRSFWISRVKGVKAATRCRVRVL
jgi:hypothetical protein